MHKEQVKKFYKVLWDAHDKDQIPSVLHEDFTFRGSLGREKRGHGGFAEYVDMVHQALGEYRCVIEELVSESLGAWRPEVLRATIGRKRNIAC